MTLPVNTRLLWGGSPKKGAATERCLVRKKCSGTGQDGLIACVMGKIWNKLIRDHVLSLFNVGKGGRIFQKRLQKDKLSLDCRYWKLDHEDSFIMVQSWFVRFYMYDLCMVDSVTFGSGTMDWQLCATVQFRTDSHLGKVQCSNCGNLIRFMPLNVWRCPCASLGAQIMHLY